MLWGGEGKELGTDPVEISHVDSFELLVSGAVVSILSKFKLKGSQDILFKAKIPQPT